MVVFDTKEDGFRTVLKDYQEAAFRYLWRLDGGGASSRDVWVNVNKELVGTPRISISRASIINYLNDMVDEELLNYTETTGKGGHHRVYRITFTEQEFKAHIAGRMISKLLREYPKETKKALQLV